MKTLNTNNVETGFIVSNQVEMLHCNISTKKAFTLVELIVVITILAILATIAFLSFQNISTSARDSSRLSDITNIKKSLELGNATNGGFPLPDSYTGITYSGATAWYQGTLGDTVVQQLKKISKTPLDPLLKAPYTYSVTNSLKEYQIGYALENPVSSTNTLKETYADTSTLLGYTEGNYNGLMLKVSTGSTDYYLAVPSIISSDVTSAGKTNLVNQTGSLVFRGKKSLPAATAQAFFGVNKTDTGVVFNPKTTGDFVIYSTGAGKTPDTSVFLTNLKNTYTGSTLTNLGDTDLSNRLSSITNNTNTLSSVLAKVGTAVSVSNTQTTVYVSGACTGLPSNAVYTNSSTGYTVTNASTLSAITAGYNASPTTNTCQWKCDANSTWNGSNCIQPPLYSFTSHTFTNCGQTGRTGPTLSTCRSSYNTTWDENNDYFNQGTHQGYQLWTVPSSGNYTIETGGAFGGYDSNSGNGAIMKGTFTLNKGDKIQIIVGQIGVKSYSYDCTGGGGGTFVAKNDNTLLIAGGGGAGRGYAHHGGNYIINKDASISTSGKVGYGNGGNGGTNGNGGYTTGNYCGNSGAGWLTDGSHSCSYNPGEVGLSRASGFLGGYAGTAHSNTNRTTHGVGGFGGGGGCELEGGGGGGYSGGGGQSHGPHGSGGGGGSYNIGTNQNNSVGNTGHGYVTITKL